ncbi:MAG: FG-GAP repeat domain-containing protein [Planctomycetota bacterium JB042]
MRSSPVLAALAAAPLLAPSLVASDPWIVFDDETAARLGSNPPTTSTADTAERSLAFGDLDLDGDLDLVVARKGAYTLAALPNVLFVNEGTADGQAIDGVLVDRTAALASASDVAGDQGFLTPTRDRDVTIVDVDGDGLLDVVTAVAFGLNEAKHLTHPRVYVNLGASGGAWTGLRYEDARVPSMHPTVGPLFASVSAGDVTGDGAPDLWFTDFDKSESPPWTGTVDYQNRLLANDGFGFFTDVTTTALTPPMAQSAYGAAGAVADMNGDGANDLVKQSSNLNPLHIAVAYNDPNQVGTFNLYDVVYAFPKNGYSVSTGDLNADGREDLIVTDNNTDRYLLNQGNDALGQATFLELQFPFLGFDFGGNSYATDLDDDGLPDVLITDMDVDVPGCFRRMHVYRNRGDVPNVTFVEELRAIPPDRMKGTHDVAEFDVDGDGKKDVVAARCASTEVWRQRPFLPFGDGCAGTGGVVPSLEVLGSPAVGGTASVAVDQTLGGAPVFLVVGPGAAALPMGFGCDLLVQPPLSPLVGPFPATGSGAGAGQLAFSAAIPAGAPPGRFAVQAFVADAGGAGGFANTNGVAFTVP